MSNFFRTIRRVAAHIIFSPFSPILTLLVGWVLTLLSSVPNNDLPPAINTLITHKMQLVYFLLAWFIFASIYHYYFEKNKDYMNQISKLQHTISNMETQLQQSAGIIMNKYGEFAAFKKQAIFADMLKEFVCGTTIIDSAQIYTYSTSLIKKNVQIKLVSESSFAYEGVDINQILQTYYPIQKDIYNKFLQIVHLWKSVQLGLNEQMTAFEYENMQESLTINVQSLFEDIYNKLKDSSKVDALDDSTLFNQYRILTLLYQLSNSSDRFNITPKLLPNNPELESFLAMGKRTGILGAILLQQTFIFRHAGDSAKHGRIYVCFPFVFSDQNYCILCTIPPAEDPTIEQCSYIRQKFIKILQKFQ